MIMFGSLYVFFFHLYSVIIIFVQSMERMNEKKFFEYAHSNRMDENEKKEKNMDRSALLASLSLSILI